MREARMTGAPPYLKDHYSYQGQLHQPKFCQHFFLLRFESLKSQYNFTFDSCGRPNNVKQKLDLNHWFFSLCDLEIWWMTLKKNRAPLLYHIQLCPSFQSHWWIQTGVTVQKRSIQVKIWDFLSCVTFKKNKTSLLYHVKFCASFQSHRWIQTWVTIRKRSIGVKIENFLVPGELEIWRMTSKNNRALLLCYFKLCAPFHSHCCIQTGVTVWKCQIWVKIDDSFSPVTLKFDVWLWKTIGDLS